MNTRLGPSKDTASRPLGSRFAPVKAGVGAENLRGFMRGPGLKYVWIPPGRFQMGCVPGDAQCHDTERPRHQVSIARGFWMGESEVTVAAYRRFVAATRGRLPSAPGFDQDSKLESHPILNVTWHDAKAFCEWSGGRLPAEAEWEYAARGGRDGLKYPWGNALSHDEANGWGTDGKDRWDGTSPVGSFAPNGFALFDVAGNVWEWCADAWHGSYNGAPVDGSAWSGGGSARVLRGGSGVSLDVDLKPSGRVKNEPAATVDLIGFRCAQDAGLSSARQ